MKELYVEAPAPKTREDNTEEMTLQLENVIKSIGGKHDGTRGDVLEMEWMTPEVRDFRDRPYRVIERCESLLRPNTNFWKRVTALLGREPNAEERQRFNVGSLFGNTCRAKVRRRETAKGTKLVIVELLGQVGEQG